MNTVQHLATRIFMYASVAFGIIGISIIVLSFQHSADNETLGRMLGICVFIILPSFALSVAGKYLMPQR